VIGQCDGIVRFFIELFFLGFYFIGIAVFLRIRMALFSLSYSVEESMEMEVITLSRWLDKNNFPEKV
jgi:hypothetical protein